jgi:glycine dehydrogenase
VPPADRIPFQRPQPQDDRLMTFKLTDYQPYDFANRRHIGPSPSEMEDMLQVVGAPSLDALIDETVPASIRQTEPLTWGRALSEQETLWHLKDVASKNRVLTSLIGMGYYGTVTPPVIQRNILGKSGLVHVLYPLPTRDQPGPARSAA